MVDENDDINHRTQFRHLYEGIAAVGTLTTALLRRAVEEDRAVHAARVRGDAEPPVLFMTSPHEQDNVRRLYTTWEERFVSDAEAMNEIRVHIVGNEKKLVKNTLGMHVHFELTRLHALQYRVQLVTERDNLRRYSADSLSTHSYLTLFSLANQTQSSMWVSLVQSFEPDLVTDKEKVSNSKAKALEVRDKLRAMWPKPVLSYTQSEVRLLMFFLTQQLDDVPTRNAQMMAEYRTVYMLVWLRIAELMQEVHLGSVLDEESMRTVYPGPPGPGGPRYCFNRPFAAFCSIYMGELLRRFFYYDLLRHNNTLNIPSTDVLHAAGVAWITRIVHELAEEAFEDMYAKVGQEEGYTYVGDDAWFKFMYPHMNCTRGACITVLRPHLYNRFFSEAYVSKTAALASVSLTARLFMLHAIDEHIRINAPHVHWLDAIVIPNAALSQMTHMLSGPGQSPLLVQVFSSYWVYDSGQVHICDSVYEAVAVWFWLLETRYEGQLFKYDMRDFIRAVLPSHVRREVQMASFEL